MQLTAHLKNEFNKKIAYNLRFPPAYQYSDGWFALAVFAYDLQPQDALDEKIAHFIAKNIKEEYNFATFSEAAKFLWFNVDLRFKMNKFYNEIKANKMAKKMFFRLLKRKPGRILENFKRIFCASFKKNISQFAARSDLYLLFTPQQITNKNRLMIKDTFGIEDIKKIISQKTFSKKYYLSSNKFLRFIPYMCLLLIILNLIFALKCRKLHPLVLFLILGCIFYASVLAIYIGNISYRIFFPLLFPSFIFIISLIKFEFKKNNKNFINLL